MPQLGDVKVQNGIYIKGHNQAADNANTISSELPSVHYNQNKRQPMDQLATNQQPHPHHSRQMTLDKRKKASSPTGLMLSNSNNDSGLHFRNNSQVGNANQSNNLLTMN